LPYSPYGAESSQMIHRAGKEILLHLPMEPWQQQNREEPGTLFVSMSGEELKKQLLDDLNAVPYVAGVNNHMGSRFMENDEKLSIVFSIIKDRGLFFVDSLTTNHSKGDRVADQVGMPIAARKIFIDNSQDYEDTLNILISQRIGGKKPNDSPLILIGHPHPTTIQAIKRAIPVLREKGFMVVPVSRLVHINEKRAD
ncbi:MAG: divergent polysaccharide deacetylase family protein, partial [Syntrophales bacterium]|nr:divergent polysaccharide deacetylase family protein [Syntrophales bacterium]